MIIQEKGGNILESGETRIAFAVNIEGFNDAGFAGTVQVSIGQNLQTMENVN